MNKEITKVAKEEKIARKEMVKELERVHQEYTEAMKLQEDLKSNLVIQKGVQQKLTLEVSPLLMSGVELTRVT